MFRATPPVIRTGAIRPIRFAIAETREAIASWIPAMMFSRVSPFAISEITSDSAKTVQRLLIFAGRSAFS